MTPKFCMDCGAKLEEGHKFCMQCGTPCVMPSAPVQETAPPQESAAPSPFVPLQETAVPVQEPIYSEETVPQEEIITLQEPVVSPQEEEAPLSVEKPAPNNPCAEETPAQEATDDAVAAFHAGRDHLLGDHGAAVDNAKALSCFQEAYEKGHGAAARWLAAAHILAAVELVRSAPPASDSLVEAGAREQ